MKTIKNNYSVLSDRINLLIKGVTYIIMLSNQLPSVIIYKNQSIILIMLLGIGSSILFRIMLIDLDLLTPFLLFSVYILITLSIIYILNLQINIILRLFHSINLIPIFYRLVKENKKKI